LAIDSDLASVSPNTPRRTCTWFPRLSKPIAVPWVWKYHGYPKDYYRFTHTAIEYLYPSFTWDKFAWSSTSEGDIQFQEMDQITERKMIIAEHSPDGKKTNKYIKYLSINMLGTKNA
jgi:hypothetical protein